MINECSIIRVLNVDKPFSFLLDAEKWLDERPEFFPVKITSKLKDTLLKLFRDGFVGFFGQLKISFDIVLLNSLLILNLRSAVWILSLYHRRALEGLTLTLGFAFWDTKERFDLRGMVNLNRHWVW